MSTMRGRLPLMAGLVLALAPARGAAQAAAGVDTSPPSTWRFEVSADGRWYENAYFVGPVLADTAWSTTGRATLSRDRRFQSGSYSFSGFGGVIYYPEIDAFNQPTYGGSFDLNWRTGRRTTLRLGQRYERTNTRLLEAQDAEGLPLPTSEADYATSTLGLRSRLSQHWQLEIDGSYYYRHYYDELLTDSNEVEAGMRIGRQAGRSGLVYLGYQYTSVFLEDRRLRTHEVLMGGRKQPPKTGVGFELAAGVGYVESTGEWYPAGNAGLSFVGRDARLDLRYDRDFGQAYGYRRQTIGDLASARLTWTPHRKLGFDASYNLSYRRDPADDGYTITSWIAGGGFSWEVGGGVGLGAHYSYERNDTTGLPVLEGGRATASLSYGVDWR